MQFWNMVQHDKCPIFSLKNHSTLQLVYGGVAAPHLYINNLYPPEYAELDHQARQQQQHETCYASTDLLEQPYNQVLQL